MFPVDNATFDAAMKRCGILDLRSATIRQICALSAILEGETGERCVHLEMGNPGLPASRVGIEAEVEVLRQGLPNKYPDIAGLPRLKKAGERFVKSFMNLDIPARCIIPTVGSMQGCFTTFLLLGQRFPERDTILFLNPGFPAQRNQAKVLGLREESFDIYEHRGEALEAALDKALSSGRVTAMLYCNPNNPAWTNLTERELEIIGKAATKYDVIAVEDVAYFGMDFRTDYSKPGCEPYPPTVARYTDNYIIMLSASKIFSYAGQRIALVCLSPAVADREYDYFRSFYEMPRFIDAYVFGVLYTASSGTAHSPQYALAAMLEAACDGTLDFVGDSREYGNRAALAKKAFTDAGFHLVYAKDGDEPISDGFFFTVGYPGMDSVELQRALLRHGVATISLPGTGSRQDGVRVCVSLLDNPEVITTLNTRLQEFKKEYALQAAEINT
ncbi:MAG: pyridoxal phosphate-dependent aminotransferase [Bacteroides sp.]|nr:pyridoxal phosphate-dependent aminotransferase [Bacteroidales bacterium]MBD5316086.1 pyridoxal phosphate-dependent aminotransferase [Bacteroides sp.]MBD5316130.1 pyridoxal phosphate-dependent aminotransferase [Bacteroides sp.]MBD5377921.1 pyridoxal phosphate-dependent aminotransferase [Bacteroides sp.]